MSSASEVKMIWRLGGVLEESISEKVWKLLDALLFLMVDEGVEESLGEGVA